MLDLTNHNSEICVIGRTNFNVGIGAVTYAACELFARNFPINIYPTDKSNKEFSTITLPNGRLIPVCKDLKKQKVFFYTDVLWNGSYDLNYTLVADHGFRIAHIAYDSDELPSKWVEILNSKFDLALFSSQHLEAIAIKSGVRIAIGTLPIALDINAFLARSFKKVSNKRVRFGSIAAFHKRKGMDILVEAFLEYFADNEDVELIIHSNLAIGETYEKIIDLINKKDAKNIILSHQNLDEKQKLELFESIDIFVNCSRGEGYSIGPREALALGKVVVISDIGAHQDLMKLPGVFSISPTIAFPARYPEIDNQIFGKQYSVDIANTQKALSQALNFYNKKESYSSMLQRKKRASEFEFSALSTDYSAIINPNIHAFRKAKKSSNFVNISTEARKIAIRKVGNYCEKLNVKNRIVVPAHDAGFFSIFNVFMSHLVWDLSEDRCHMVLPDWDVSRLLKKTKENKVISFCYGQPDDGNLWLKFFEPLYGLTKEQMNNESFLYKNSATPKFVFNENREPLLTYINAYDLYNSSPFINFRKQYNRVYLDHIKLLPKFQREIDSFCQKNFSDKFVIAVHIKHPSHIIEQPQKAIAHTNLYIESIFAQLSNKNIPHNSTDWRIFLATDQDKVVKQFKEKFGDRVSYFEDVRRTTVQEDDFFESLSKEEKEKEGYQVQHLVASSLQNWSYRMAWEVIRDAMVMSRCNVLLHVVSNVSTAVSYFNPDIELVFCK